MSKVRNEKLIREELDIQVKKLDWDALSYDIILISTAISIEKDSNYLKLLQIKLEIWEKEKTDMVHSQFDMQRFLEKDSEFDDLDIF